MRISKLLSMLLGFSLARFYVDEEAPGGNANPEAKTTQAQTFSREYVSELREEAKSWRVKFQERDASLTETTGKLTAAEKAATESVTAAESKANERVLRAELKSFAVKHGVVDVSDALKVLDLSGVKIDADGNVTGADELFEAAKKAKPYLFGGEPSSSSTRTVPKPKADNEPVDVRKMTPEQYAAHKQGYLKQ